MQLTHIHHVPIFCPSQDRPAYKSFKIKQMNINLANSGVAPALPPLRINYGTVEEEMVSSKASLCLFSSYMCLLNYPHAKSLRFGSTRVHLLYLNNTINHSS